MAKAKPKEQETTNSEPRKYVATIRTALAGQEDGIVKKLPESYVTGTVKEVLEYLTEPKNLTETEALAARSIKNEMERRYTVTVNGQTANPEDQVADLFKTQTHRGTQYESLEMEIASTQTGGGLVYLMNR
jgi:hypothetical protein